MSTAIFWGSILLLIGLTMIINVIFKIDLPVARIAVAAVLIFIGVKLLLGKHLRVFNHESAQCNVQYNATDKSKQEYNVVFSKGSVDLRNITLTGNEPVRVDVHTVFAHTELHLTKDMPFRITSNTAFASVNIPNADSVVVGTTGYQSDSLDTSKPYLDIKLDCVFGQTELVFH